MKKLEKLIQRLLEVDAAQKRAEAIEAAKELWDYPYEAEINNKRLRDSYISALFYVSDYFRNVGSVPYNAIAPLKRAFSLDDGHFIPAANSSAKEAAAYKLGNSFERAKCHHSAVYWLRQSLSLARSSGMEENILLNLNDLARNLQILRLHDEAGRCYDEILDKLNGTSPDSDQFQYLVHAAIHQLQHGNKPHGEAIMRQITSEHFEEPARHAKPLPEWLYSASHELGLHYINSGRSEEAIKLSRMVIKAVEQFAELNWVRVAMHGLMAKALIHRRQLDRALQELEKARKTQGKPTSYKDTSLVASRELLIDAARIHIANHNYESAIAAYRVLAYDLGALISDNYQAPTNRLRFYWLQQMAFVVHEMASAWLANPEVHANAMLEAAVANALLQLKANLFIALERHKNVRGELGSALFQANRTYAAAARKAANNKDGLEGLLELEDSVLWREKIERQFLSGEFISAPGAAVIFERDFRELYILGDDTVLDYSLINYQPPDRGLIGASKGLRYVGIKLAAGSLSLFDLGAAQEIEDLCRPLVRTYSSPPGAPDRQRQVELVLPDSFKEKVDLESLAQRVYDRVVAPFEPLGKSLVFSPDGMLAAVPFHALINNQRYLIEEKNIAYCHSMLQRESLTARQSNSLLGSPPPIQKVAVILGNPNYDEMHLPSLPGTGIEVTEVAALLSNQKFKDGRKVYDGVRTYTGAQATASQLLEIEQPTIVHIAAHGTFDKKQTRIFTNPTVTLGRYYRRSQRMGSEPLTALDNALLHSTLVLAKDIEAEDDPANGSILTALELASLNLTHCNVVVLSACETGAGATESGAGVLGFQYALQACFARCGLLSLWKVLDRETSAFMIDFYQNAARHNFKAAYQATLRKHCRRDGKRVHPYYWAAFVFMDQTY